MPRNGSSGRRVPADRIALVRNPVLVSNTNHPIDMMRPALRQKAGCSGRDDRAPVLRPVSARRRTRPAWLKWRPGCLPILEWQLWFLGTGKTERKSERRSPGKGLDDRVHFWGFQADPSPWIKAADIAVRASRSDSLPNFLIEAQWLGLACRDHRRGRSR